MADQVEAYRQKGEGVRVLFCLRRVADVLRARTREIAPASRRSSRAFGDLDERFGVRGPGDDGRRRDDGRAERHVAVDVLHASPTHPTRRPSRPSATSFATRQSERTGCGSTSGSRRGWAGRCSSGGVRVRGVSVRPCSELRSSPERPGHRRGDRPRAPRRRDERVVADIDAEPRRRRASAIDASARPRLAGHGRRSRSRRFRGDVRRDVRAIGPRGHPRQQRGAHHQPAVREIDAAEWDDVLAVNLRGVLFGCQIAGAHMASAGVRPDRQPRLDRRPAGRADQRARTTRRRRRGSSSSPRSPPRRSPRRA